MPAIWEESYFDDDSTLSTRSISRLGHSVTNYNSDHFDYLSCPTDGTNRMSFSFILALCAGWFGLQQVFTIFMGSGHFYLRSLGFSDVLISFTWLSGPIAGMVFQPVVGAMSDNCSHSWGKRRPFILIGTFALVCAMVSIAWAKEFTTAISGVNSDGSGLNHRHRDDLSWDLLIFVNVFILVANFAIQPVQMGLRALVVDLVPTHQQGQAHVWIARLNLVGSIVGYGIGSVDLTRVFGFRGQSHFQTLCSFVSINLVVCVSITCYFGRETRPKQHVNFTHQMQYRQKNFSSFLRCLRKLDVTRRVCLAQFFCWLAWFPFLYYTAKLECPASKCFQSPSCADM
jgi:solute carrier family 45 protein 1/2/4